MLKIIGITGKSGVGKSTLAKYLGENLENSKVILVDAIHINYLLKEKKDRLIELFGDDIIVDGKFNSYYFITYPEKTKMMFDESFEDLGNILKDMIDSSITQYSWIIIDFFRLISISKIWDLCDYHILVEAIDDDKRYENITKRNQEKGKKVIRTREEECRLRDYSVEDYFSFEYEFHVLNNYDEVFLKDMDALVDKLNNKKLTESKI